MGSHEKRASRMLALRSLFHIMLIKSGRMLGVGYLGVGNGLAKVFGSNFTWVAAPTSLVGEDTAHQKWGNHLFLFCGIVTGSRVGGWERKRIPFSNPAHLRS
jgi:hypothetical protein